MGPTSWNSRVLFTYGIGETCLGAKLPSKTLPAMISLNDVQIFAQQDYLIQYTAIIGYISERRGLSPRIIWTLHDLFDTILLFAEGTKWACGGRVSSTFSYGNFSLKSYQ